jgi:hypothetical protein
MVSFGEIHIFLQFSCSGLFGGNKTKFWLETPKLQEVFLSKTKRILTGK